MSKKQKSVCSAELLKSVELALNALEKSRKHAKKLAKREKKAIAALLELEAQLEDASSCKCGKSKKNKNKNNKEPKSDSLKFSNQLIEPRNGEPDDLELIAGVGPKLAETLNELGVYHYDQIAEWQESDVEWVDTHLNFPGRITRENWIEQAKALAIGGRDEYVKVFGKEPR